MTERLVAAVADRYRIERELGRGGMATVYLAEDVRHRRRVALKVLHPELSAVLGPERFLKEIELTASLQHPHILPLFDSGSADGQLYYVMPFVEGETLRSRLERERQLPVDDAVRLAREVADALAYAHGHRVIHRDIKPENVLLQGGHALVADFGIALAVQQAGGQRMTQTGLSLGTPQYMAPEQATGEKSVDHRADVYALGAVTYEMLAGEPPFTAPTMQAVVAKLLTEEPRRLETLRRAVPPPVADAVHRALEKLPADRFARAEDFAAALRTEGTTASTVGRPATRAIGARRSTLLPWAITTVAVAAAVALGLRRSSPAPQPVVSATLQPPPGEEFMERDSFGAFSPDGGRFAFVLQSREGVNRIWVRRLSEQDATMIPGTEGAEAPFWSPDGRSLGFFSRGRLLRIDADGGRTRVLCPAPAVGGGTWNASGTILFSIERGIQKVAAEGGPCESVMHAKPGDRVRAPSMLPDGRHYLYTEGGQGARVLVGDLAGGTPRLLREWASDARFIPPHFVTFGDWTSGAGEERVIVAQRFDVRRLMLEGEDVPLTGGVRTAGGVFAYAASSGGLLAYLPSIGDAGKLETDGRGVVVDSVRLPRAWTHRQAWGRRVVALGGGRLTLYDLDRDVTTLLRETASRHPIWSPGDSVIAFTTCGLRLYRLRENRDTLVVPTVGRERCITPTDWSRDGRTIVLTVAPGDSVPHSGIATYDVGTGSLTPLVTGRSNVAEGALSPDGRWIAYQSDETGALEIYARPHRGPGATVRVSTQGGRTPRWSDDGREIVYITPDGWIMSAPVASPRAELEVAAPRQRFRAPGWSRRLFAEISGVPWDMNPSGERFIFRLPAARGSSATLLMNWQTLVRRQRGAGSQESGK